MRCSPVLGRQLGDLFVPAAFDFAKSRARGGPQALAGGPNGAPRLPHAGGFVTGPGCEDSGPLARAASGDTQGPLRQTPDIVTFYAQSSARKSGCTAGRAEPACSTVGPTWKTRAPEFAYPRNYGKGGCGAIRSAPPERLTP
jgi:hypothetical protein